MCCYTNSCQWETYSYAREDCICRKPSHLPCPMDIDDDEAESLNEEYDEPDDPRETQIMYDEEWKYE